MSAESAAKPQKILSVFDAAAFFIGIVIGVGIFKTPSIVAATTGNEWLFIGVWIAGGLATIIGALCYAELAAMYPDAGGEYNFLARAWGRRTAAIPRRSPSTASTQPWRVVATSFWSTPPGVCRTRSA